MQETARRMVAKAAPPRTDRRTLIAKALYDCIAEKGYSNTTLADVAERAGMSPSHVGYYFDNKAAILEYFAAWLYDRVSGRLPGLREAEPEALIDRIAAFRFGEGQMSTQFLGVIQEFSGLAVHDSRFHEIKSAHVADWQKYFERLFERVPPAAGAHARRRGLACSRPCCRPRHQHAIRRQSIPRGGAATVPAGASACSPGWTAARPRDPKEARDEVRDLL